jgi:hypothetical protein
MPCNMIVTTAVDLEVSDTNLLMEALKAEGFDVQQSNAVGEYDVYDYQSARPYRIANGKVYGEGDVAEVRNRIARSYTRTVIKTVTKKYGWKVKMSTDRKGVITR